MADLPMNFFASSSFQVYNQYAIDEIMYSSLVKGPKKICGLLEEHPFSLMIPDRSEMGRLTVSHYGKSNMTTSMSFQSLGIWQVAAPNRGCQERVVISMIDMQGPLD